MVVRADALFALNEGNKPQVRLQTNRSLMRFVRTVLTFASQSSLEKRVEGLSCTTRERGGDKGGSRDVASLRITCRASAAPHVRQCTGYQHRHAFSNIWHPGQVCAADKGNVGGLLK